MAIQFPSDAAGNTPYTDPSTGYIYDWDGQKWNARVPVGSGSGIAGITIQDEGVSSNQDATTLNFVGAGVDVTGDGDNTKVITIPGGGGGGVGTLQQVTDAGNSTTNEVEIGTFNATTLEGMLLKPSGQAVLFDALVGPLDPAREYARVEPGLIVVNDTTGTDDVYRGILNGTKTSSILANGTAYFGGTLPSSPNITLNADGSGSFLNTLTVTVPNNTNGFKVDNSNNINTVVCFVDNNGDGEIDIKDSVGTPQIRLYGADGSAYFGDTVKIGGTFSPDAPSITLNEDGSASFSSTVSIASTADTALRIGEATVGYKGGWDKSGNLYIGSNLFDSAESKTVEINADGTSNFTGRLSVKDDAQPWIEVGYGTDGSANHRIQWDSAKLTFNADVADDVASSGFIFNVDTERALTIDSDGNGTWTGFVLTGDSTTGTYSVMDDSAIFTSYKAAGTADETTAFQVVRDGNLEYQVRADGEIQIGGTIPAAPNIVLKADGSGWFKGFVDFTRPAAPGFQYLGIGPGGTDEKAIFVNRSGEITLEMYSDFTSTENVAISSDGNASFAGKVSTDKYFISHNDDPAVGACYLFDTSDSRTNNVALEISPTNASSNATTRLNYDGSASFAGGDSTLNKVTNGAAFNVRNNSTSQAIGVYAADFTSGERVISLNGDGSAQFEGQVRLVEGSIANDKLFTRLNKGYVTINQTDGSTTAFNISNNSTVTVDILGDGSATFSGTINGTTVGTSDEKFKENITPASSQLSDVVALGGMLKNFDWNDDAPVNESIRATRHLGLVAQQVEAVCPSLVKTLGSEDDTHKGISHDALIMKLLGAVKELDALRPTHVSFDGSGGDDFDFSTAKIASHNVASVERTAKGMFTITFTNAFASDKYTAVATAGDENHTGTGASPRCVNVVARTANSLDIVVERSDDAVQDDDGYISVFIAQ